MEAHDQSSTIRPKTRSPEDFLSRLEKLPLEIKHLIFEQLLTSPRDIDINACIETKTIQDGSLRALADTSSFLRAIIVIWGSIFSKSGSSVSISSKFGYINNNSTSFTLSVKKDRKRRCCTSYYYCGHSDCYFLILENLPRWTSQDFTLIRTFGFTFEGSDNSVNRHFNSGTLWLVRKYMKDLKELDVFCKWDMSKTLLQDWQRRSEFTSEIPWVPCGRYLNLHSIEFASEPRIAIWLSGTVLAEASQTSSGRFKFVEWLLR